jgi:carboxyl-terminal processing protease
MPSIQKAYDELAAKLKEAKANEFYTHKKDIHAYLEGEIIRRYFYRKGVVEHDFEHDEDIKESLKLFANKAEYNKLIKK